MDHDGNGVPLEAFVSALRAELARADEPAGSARPIGVVTVELTLVTRPGADGRVELWVVQPGTAASSPSDSTQTVSIQVLPQGPGSLPPQNLISGREDKPFGFPIPDSVRRDPGGSSNEEDIEVRG